MNLISLYKKIENEGEYFIFENGAIFYSSQLSKYQKNNFIEIKTPEKSFLIKENSLRDYNVINALFKKNLKVTFPIYASTREGDAEEISSLQHEYDAAITFRPQESITIKKQNITVAEGKVLNQDALNNFVSIKEKWYDKHIVSFVLEVNDSYFLFERKNFFDSQEEFNLWKKINGIDSFWEGFIKGSNALSISRLGRISIADKNDIPLIALGTFLVDEMLCPSEASWGGME